MKLVKCNSGHYYDADKYSSCPHCVGGGASGETVGDSTVGFNVNQSAAPAPASSFAPASEGTDDVTVSFGSGAAAKPAAPAPNAGGINRGFNAQGNDDETVSRPKSFSQDDDEDGKTVAFYGNDIFGSTSTAAATPEQTNKGVRPVVGWLVCTEGSNFGKSFPLYFGRNFIGRSTDMDVCLAGDTAVSRDRHAIIVYEPKARIFFAQAGEGHGLFYLNDQVVLSNVQLHDRDVLTVGQTSLVFVPFCDEHFGWEIDKQ